MVRRISLVEQVAAENEKVHIEDDDTPEQEQESVGLHKALQPPDEDADRLAEFLKLFGGKEYKVRIHKFDDVNKSWSYVDTLLVDGFDPYVMCKSYGPGRYRMTFLSDSGGYVKGGQPQIRIAEVAKPANAVAPAYENPLSHPIVAMMMTQAQQSKAELLEIFKIMAAKPEAAKSSTTEVFELMAKLQSLNPKEKSDDTMKKLSETLLMKMLEKGMEGGSGEGSGSILSDIKEALPLLREMITARRPAPSLPQPAPRPQNPPAIPNPENPPVNPILEDLKPYILVFKLKAENNIDIDRAANYLIDEIYESVIPIIRRHVTMAKVASDESIVESLLSRVKDPAQVESLYTYAPELIPHKVWVSSVISKTIHTLENPDAE